MELKTAVAFIGSIIGAIGGPAAIHKVLQSLFPHPADRLRDEIDRNLTLYERLPESSLSRDALLAAIDDDAFDLITRARRAKRDGTTIGIGVFFLVLAVAAGFAALRVPGWWQIPLWVLGVVLALFGIVGLAQGAQSVPPEERVKTGGAQQTSDETSD